ncbi:toprim domain-containing protein [Spirosoma panaciterrae]|uniref:toprim domain-containing protein n=1 Tax=Spirosoma panaciterrae TaxID=496058 RepID=UPI00036CC2AF|nr:toprim domain-containing protein [Spirosoma panaciterrae]
MTTFDEYKKRIDLSEYAQRQGWEIDRDKSTNSATVLDKKVLGETQDTIVVYKGKDHDYFYTPNHDREKGDVISFERIKNGTDWKEINDKLARYVGDVDQQRIVPQVVNTHSHNQAFQHNFKFQTITETDYLESRGISKATIYAEEFKDRIFNKEFSYKEFLERGVNQLSKLTPIPEAEKKAIQEIGLEKYYSKPFFDQLKTIQGHVKDTGQLPDNYLESLRNTYGYKAPEGATDRVIVNTSFPLRNEEHVIAAINRNSEYNRIEQSKENAVWSSRTDYDKRPVNTVVIHESPIDSLSYHQLNPPAADEKRLYIATAGNISREQPVLIEKLVKESQADKLILANDNDPGGIRQNINLAGRLNMSPESESIHAQLNVHERTDGRLLITLVHQNQQEGQQRLTQLAERFTTAINKTIPEGAEKEAKATIIQNGTRSSELEIAFTANRENLIRVEKALLQERGLTNYMQVQRPTEKDYNEDLKRATPFIVAYQEPNGRENIAGRYKKEVEAYAAVAEKAQEKPQTQVSAYMEIKTPEGAKKVELAHYDQESQKVVATPEFGKRVEEQQKQQEIQDRTQQITLASAKANTGDIKVVDGDGNTVARTEYTVEVSTNGQTKLRKESQYDQDELTREGTSGKELQTAMNKEVASATGAGKGNLDGADLKDTKQDISQEQEAKRGLSM